MRIKKKCEKLSVVRAKIEGSGKNLTLFFSPTLDASQPQFLAFEQITYKNSSNSIFMLPATFLTMEKFSSFV